MAPELRQSLQPIPARVTGAAHSVYAAFQPLPPQQTGQAMGGYTEAAAASGGIRSRRDTRSRRPRRASWGDRWFHRLAVLPTTLIMLLIFGIPLLFSAWLSIEAWAPDQQLFGGRFA